MKTLLTLVLLFTACQVQAELYKSLDANGEVIYSDEPPTISAKEFVPPPLQVTPPIKYKPKAKTPAEEKPAPYPYSDIHFTQPEADANFYDNEGNISYSLAITPGLNTKLGHYLNFKLDGSPVASKSSSLSGTVNNVERGSHSLTADICDASGKVLRSANVSFHLHKVSKLQPKPSKPAAPKPTP